MLRHPFRILAIIFVVSVVIPPLAVFIGYPALLVVGAGCLVRQARGSLEAPRQAVAILAIYLGAFLILHGFAIGVDTSFASPRSAEEKWLGKSMVILGGLLAGVAAVAAYAFDTGPPRTKKPGEPFDELEGPDDWQQKP